MTRWFPSSLILKTFSVHDDENGSIYFIAKKERWGSSRPALLTGQHVSESLCSLVETQITRLQAPEGSDSVRLGWGLGMCISNQFPVATDSASLGNSLRTTALVQSHFSLTPNEVWHQVQSHKVTDVGGEPLSLACSFCHISLFWARWRNFRNVLSFPLP